MRRSIWTAATIGLVILPSRALADTWLVAEAPAALAVSDAQGGVFRPGAMPAVGVYAQNDRFALGLRMRAGVLRNGPAPGNNLEDPSFGGLTTAGVAIRVSAYGGWTELVAGGGVTGRDLVPAIEAGIGWSFAAGSVDIGPSIRYMRVVSRDKMDAFGTAELALVGIDVRFGKQRPARMPAFARVASTRVAVVDPEPTVRDHDRALDSDASCAEHHEGCSVPEVLGEDLVIVNDRIVLDERVLFDFNRARVRTRGRTVIAELTRIWREHPDWRHITIEGHADVRGSDEHNVELSQLRADRVRRVMVELGCAEDSISAIGYGRSRIRDSAATDEAHQRNRRVEFVIQRGANQ